MSIEIISKAQLKEKLVECRGNMARVARGFGLTRWAIAKRVREDPDLAEFVQNLKESYLDDVEDGLYELALKGNVAAIIFTLKTQGKSRGYTEKVELTGPDGLPLGARPRIEIELGTDDQTQTLDGNTTAAALLAE